jgi:ketosteroid isomerase-like protein
MSQENVELVRQGYDTMNRGDLEGVLDLFTADFEFHTAQLFPDAEPVYRGREGFRRFWSGFREPWETLLLEVERIEPIGDDRVLALLRFHGRARDGLDVMLVYAHLLTIEGGMVSRMVGFADWQQALEAACLRE